MISLGLVFGLNYSRHGSKALRGCINDAHHVGKFLRESLAYDNVEVVTDEYSDVTTTSSSIMRKMVSLSKMTHVHKVSNIWIHFSGHGTQVRDRSGDEVDKMDECIVPSDFQTTGYIRDDFFRWVLTRVHPHTKVHMVFDCCHSGSIVDLPWTYETNTPVFRDTYTRQRILANVITISGCRDTSISRDIRKGNQWVGALTSELLTKLQNTPSISIQRLIEELRIAVSIVSPGQYPMLTSSKEISPAETLI